MLRRQIAKAIFVSRAWILSIAFLASVGAIVDSSTPFKACVKEAYYNPETENFEKDIPSFSAAFEIYGDCFGNFLHDYSETIIAAFTIILALSTIFLWVATRDLVRGAEETARRQLRAYIFVNNGFFELMRTDKNRVFIDGFLNFKNFGKTPGYELVSCTRMDIFDTDSPSFGDDLKGLKKSVIGPGSERDIRISKGPIDEADLASIRRGAKSIFIWGRIDYIDAFNKHRYLKFFNMSGREILIPGDPPSHRWPLAQADKPYEGN